MSILESLLIVSEKAANIARTCRQNQHLFKLLVQEKGTDEANPRFVDDFKTLADVLIQEMVKHDVGNKFPEITDSIFGEENNVFENKLGEKICVKVLKTAEETKKLLIKVLNNDEEAADLLAEIIHEEIDLKIDLPIISENIEDFAIWIDPIDSTAEYINGIEKLSNSNIYTTGLKCVTVLIGIFNKKTGNPISGIINQPFFEENQQLGRRFWSFNNQNSLKTSQNLSTNRICLSSSENPDIKEKLRTAGFELVEAAGAGYKSLLVILGEVDAYILSKNSTFKWDTCAPQAILSSMNGGIINYQEAIKGNVIPICYDVCNGENKLLQCCNEGGIIAFNNETVLKCILEALRK
ncbi:inositol polyphosphate 1-phosphatase [Onthophagus taurus]|uniref:inositol polyphosphate 1-phosphatase n=1 Tax=Onthophagus taurus TaxID=166361 RepID=UPI000C20F822|nr:inositol polyphosphate 1-phosphatase [Onthophagus taurus]